MESLQIDPRSRGWLTALGLDSCAAIVKVFASTEAPSKSTVTIIQRRVQLSDQSTRTVFYKLYRYTSPSWKFWWRRSKARCEFENYAALEKLDIPTARRVVCGEMRDAIGRLSRAFIVTEEIPRAWTLPQFIEEFCPNRTTFDNRRLRDGLCRQLATLVRRMHDGGFFHHDLVWRNILVTWEPPAAPKMWWVDCPRGGFSRQRRRQIKDLASLDKMASMHCSRTERLVFLKSYGGNVRSLARDVHAYRRKRWPDE